MDRLERLLDPASAARRDALIEQARAVYRDESFDASAAASVLIANAQARATKARDIEEARIAGARPAGAGGGDARQARSARRRARGAARAARGARRLVPRPRRGRRRCRIGGDPSRQARAAARRTRPATGCSEPSARPKRHAIRGARSRSSTSHRRWRWRRCSCGLRASWPDHAPATLGRVPPT